MRPRKQSRGDFKCALLIMLGFAATSLAQSGGSQDSGLIRLPEIVDPAVEAPGEDDADPIQDWCSDCSRARKECDCKKSAKKVKSKPKPDFPTVIVTGFFQADATRFDFDPTSPTLPGIGVRPADSYDVRGFRRARLAARGQTAKNVDYMIEFDFAFPGRPTFMDLYFDVRGLPFGSVRVGQWRQPFGLGELTSVKELTFHERASMFFLGPFRKTGIGLYDSNERSTYAVSLFGGTVSNIPDQFGTSIGDSNYGLAARVTRLLIDDSCRQLHVGSGYSHIELDDELSRTFVIGVLPEVVGAPNDFGLVPGTLTAVVFPSTQVDLFNTELAAIFGPAHIESEMRFGHYDRAPGDVLVPAFYAQMGYVLTGESRDYNRANGVVGGVIPRRPFGPTGPGAWEVAARYSHIDLNGDGLRGGRANNFIVGLNWYLNGFTKFQFNYLRSLIDRFDSTDAVNIYSMRGQVAF